MLIRGRLLLEHYLQGVALALVQWQADLILRWGVSIRRRLQRHFLTR